jgi:hypothetical protein
MMELWDKYDTDKDNKLYVFPYWLYSLLMSRNYDEWAKMVAQIKKSYPLAQQYLEKVYVTPERQGD